MRGLLTRIQTTKDIKIKPLTIRLKKWKKSFYPVTRKHYVANTVTLSFGFLEDRHGELKMQTFKPKRLLVILFY